MTKRVTYYVTMIYYERIVRERRYYLINYIKVELVILLVMMYNLHGELMEYVN